MKFYPLIACVAAMLLLIMPAFAEDASPAVMQSAGALYSQSVDLANEGRYQQALDASDKALAMNVTSLTGLIQSNRAGILVMLDRNNEAVTAADAALAIEGNLTGVHSTAWYNKGNALKNLGRTAEAKDAYAHAYALDKTLVPPYLGPDGVVTTPVPPTDATVPATSAVSVPSIPAPATPAPTAKSPVSLVTAIVALGAVFCICAITRKN
jgi:tetratricopeptide (TPR) repeat protein